MAKILLISYDMQPDLIPIWKDTWDELKEKHDSLQVTTFTVPLWGGRSSLDVFRNRDFKQWCKEHKWVEVGQQGYMGRQPPDCMRFNKPQHFMLKRGYRKIGSYLPEDYYSFHPPFNRMNEHTLRILRNLGFSSCFYNKQLIVLKKAEKPLEDYIVIESHISIEEKYPDDIQHINRKLNKHLSNLEEKGYEYTTIRDLLKNALGEEGNKDEECLVDM